MPRLTNDDIHYWQEGRHFKCYERLGAHPNRQGTWFGVWAPNADEVSVVGSFNDWTPGADALHPVGGGLWEGYSRKAREGHLYKFRMRNGNQELDKTDPFAFAMEPPTGSKAEGLAAIITSLDGYEWQDAEWMNSRKGPETLEKPLSIYEVHLGSWKRGPDGMSLSYRDIAEPLADHVENLGFTHIEFLPLAEHPYYGSWGYQVVGYYAPTFRYGTPEDLMYLIDYLHQRGIGVIMDWVPGHFAPDPQGLANFDGTPLFEYTDMRMRHHPDWGTYVFDFGKAGVRSFLLANALFWMEHYHIDGLRVDAVASMLYRDYSRGHDWSPNIHGGRENLEAISLMQEANSIVYEHFPEAITLAEESTAWPGVTRPADAGGLGFLFKWNMGWMHDTLEYMSNDPIHRKYRHGELTHTIDFAFSEQYALPLSHDEVVHGKGSLWGKMPGDAWQKAANLRLLYGHMYGHPGKKLLFMGSELGQPSEWDHDAALEWDLADDDLHGALMRWIRDLNALYAENPALWKDDYQGFEWIDFGDRDQSVVSYQRKNGHDSLYFVFNFTPQPRHNYRVGMANEGTYVERLNSDAEVYSGSGIGNLGAVHTDDVAQHGFSHSLSLSLPPLGVIVLEQGTEGSAGELY